jgi:serine/threonine protein kinase
VVRGVQFIHSKRILHLDLKPFNIIFANQNDDYNLRHGTRILRSFAHRWLC